jgi:hypothetical protein|tara:strand:+ start:519 stop:866 length:348 start_codon:yes stop_codon:yes gene_type:complete
MKSIKRIIFTIVVIYGFVKVSNYITDYNAPEIELTPFDLTTIHLEVDMGSYAEQTLNFPDSYKRTSYREYTKLSKDTLYATLKYRGENAFKQKSNHSITGYMVVGERDLNIINVE